MYFQLNSDTLRMDEQVRVRGQFVLKHVRDGIVVDTRKFDNTIVNTGKEQMAKLINGVSSSVFNMLQIGTGTTTVTTADTTLDTYNDEETATCTYESGYISKYFATFAFTGTVSVTECGVFDDPEVSSPIMLCRQVFSALSMVNGDSLELTWRVTFS